MAGKNIFEMLGFKPNPNKEALERDEKAGKFLGWGECYVIYFNGEFVESVPNRDQVDLVLDSLGIGENYYYKKVNPGQAPQTPYDETKVGGNGENGFIQSEE